MRHALKVVMLVAPAALIAAPVVAQDEKRKKKQKRGQDRGVASRMMNQLKQLDLTDEQKEKIKKIVAIHEPKLKEVAAKARLTPEQQKAGTEARKKAAAEGKKGKEARAAMQAALKLTDEQKKVRDAQQKIQREFQKQVGSVLTPEQLKKFRGGKKRGEDKGEKKRKKRDK